MVIIRPMRNPPGRRALTGIVLALFLVVPAWAQEKGWNETLAAAKKEGAVVVAGYPDPVMRREVVPMFRSRFGIAVEFVSGRSAEIAAKLRFERRAGLYSIDIFLGSVNTTVNVLYAEKMIDPLKPSLIHAKAVDPSKWKTGKLWFIDPGEKYVLRPFRTIRSLFHINTDYVKPDEIRSSADLLNPKWRGKISTDDPTAPGGGSAKAGHFYHQLGEEFVKRLYFDQKPVRSRNRRQMSDWLARGVYPICLNCQDDDVRALRREGFKLLQVFELSDVQASVTASPWLLTLQNKAPHPNAASIFANWAISKEGMEIYSRGYGAATLRNDVDESFLNPRAIPRPGINYFDEADWKWAVQGRRKTRNLVRKLLKLR